MYIYDVSIITCVFNAVDTIESTITSVLSQTYPMCEFILIDGGSTDGSLELIKKFDEEIDYWVSERDQGIYEAMNKGARKASGDYLFFLNADDWFADETVVEEVFTKVCDKKPDLIYGNSIRVYPGFQAVISRKLKRSNLRRGVIPSHQASFISKESFWMVDGYDDAYQSAGDFDLYCRLEKTNISSIFIDLVISYVLSGGKSSYKDLSHTEVCFIIKKHYGFVPGLLFWLKNIFLGQNIKKILIYLGLKGVYKRLLKMRME
jgi:glycosyltransferase involved in cell wall biosynthesis